MDPNASLAFIMAHVEQWNRADMHYTLRNELWMSAKYMAFQCGEWADDVFEHVEALEGWVKAGNHPRPDWDKYNVETSH